MAIFDLRRNLSEAKQTFLRRSVQFHAVGQVPKGYFAVYVGEEEKKMKRFVIPIAFLKSTRFQELLSRSHEGYFGYFDHPILGALTIPCSQEFFVELTSGLGTNKTQIL